jgi:O-antigen ligase
MQSSSTYNATIEMMDSTLVNPSIIPFPTVRYAYYVFIFSIPIETLDMGIQSEMSSLSKFTGLVFIATALLQPELCFKKPPKAFWYFVAYLFGYICLALFQPPEFIRDIVIRVVTLIQLFILFWISSNLLAYQAIRNGTLIAFGSSCVLLAITLITGAEAIDQGRITAMGQNANTLAGVLSLGLLGFLGLMYGRANYEVKLRLLMWPSLALLATGIVVTGSRAALLSLIIGILLLMASGGQSFLKIKVMLVCVLVLGFLGWSAYQNEAIWARWERAYSQGNLAGREEIFPLAWAMFMEKPLFGWGPVSHYVELGARFDEEAVDPHNLYLWILTEVGLFGAIPFFIGIWICWRAAWSARQGPEGAIPLALLACVLSINMANTWHCRKMFWLVLAYTTASSMHAFLSTKWSHDNRYGPFAGKESYDAYARVLDTDLKTAGKS